MSIVILSPDLQRQYPELAQYVANTISQNITSANTVLGFPLNPDVLLLPPGQTENHSIYNSFNSNNSNNNVIFPNNPIILPDGPVLERIPLLSAPLEDILDGISTGESPDELPTIYGNFAGTISLQGQRISVVYRPIDKMQKLGCLVRGGLDYRLYSNYLFVNISFFNVSVRRVYQEGRYTVLTNSIFVIDPNDENAIEIVLDFATYRQTEFDPYFLEPILRLHCYKNSRKYKHIRRIMAKRSRAIARGYYKKKRFHKAPGETVESKVRKRRAMLKKEKWTKSERKAHFSNFVLASQVSIIIKEYFPDVWLHLEECVNDPRATCKHKLRIIFLTRIFAYMTHCESMRCIASRMDSPVNGAYIEKNIYAICGELPEDALPYWETINRVLEKIDVSQMQDLVVKIVKRFMKLRIFGSAKINGTHWQVIIDGTQLLSSKKELPGYYTYKVHNKGKKNQSITYSYYVLEAKIVFGPNLCFSFMTEYVNNKFSAEENLNENGEPFDKQDCERNAMTRLLAKIREKYGDLPLCITADALYASDPCIEDIELYHNWKYIIRYKTGCIPTLSRQFHKIRAKRKTEFTISGKYTYDYVTNLEYQGHKINMCMYVDPEYQYPFYFITNLSVNRRNVANRIAQGRRRWKIEETFQDQKIHGYALEHQYSKNYYAMQCHYFLLQIAHMIAQIYEARFDIWAEMNISQEAKFDALLNSLRNEDVSNDPAYTSYLAKTMQLAYVDGYFDLI